MKRKPPPQTKEEILQIVHDELVYWKQWDDPMSIAAVGACANIYAAICMGQLEPKENAG